MSPDLYDDRGEGSERPQPREPRPEPPSQRPRPPSGRAARLRARIRRLLAYLGAFATLAIAAFGISGIALAASPTAPPTAPASERVVDTAGVFSQAAADNAEQLIADVERASGGRAFVYTQTKTVATTAAAVADAQDLMTRWQVGGSAQRTAILLFDVAPDAKSAQAGLADSAGFAAFLPDDERIAIVDDSMADYLAAGNLDGALTAGLSRLDLDVQVMASGGCVGSACPPAGPTPAAAPTSPSASTAAADPTATPPATTPRPSPGTNQIPAGPPYPPPIAGRRVYDQAGVFTAYTIAKLQSSAEGIEQRTAAQVVVYTQIKPGVTTREAERDAASLIDQWGIGRKGFDDGLVILFDLDTTRKHGQVQLYAGPGFRDAFLSNGERQAIYQDDMLPLLREADLNAAVLVAMSRVDAAATHSHAQSLQFGRQLNAVIGLVVGPIVFLLLIGWAAFEWFRHGRDPHYLDDPSIYVAGPPAELTPASGAFILDGGSSRRALTTALLDLASRGEVTFREDDQGMYGKVGLQVGDGDPDAVDGQIANSRPLGPAEISVRERLRALADAEPNQYLDPTALREFGNSVSVFDDALERQVIAHGWYKEAPRISRNRWLGRAVLEILVGSGVLFAGLFLPGSGPVLLGIFIVAAGIATFVLAFSMPVKTMAGAMIQAMLAAYRRTLAKTMSTARSLNQVVAESNLPWLRTPDQAMVWATAVGLQPELDRVLQRSLVDVAANPSIASSTYFPAWFVATSAFASGGGGGGVSMGERGSILSATAVPNFGGMLAALATIGSPPISTSGGSDGGSSSSSGSFGGGSSGGGGGGAGGGF